MQTSSRAQTLYLQSSGFRAPACMHHSTAYVTMVGPTAIVTQNKTFLLHPLKIKLGLKNIQSFTIGIKRKY